MLLQTHLVEPHSSFKALVALHVLYIEHDRT